jgi:hypothetical protein
LRAPKSENKKNLQTTVGSFGRIQVYACMDYLGSNQLYFFTYFQVIRVTPLNPDGKFSPMAKILMPWPRQSSLHEGPLYIGVVGQYMAAYLCSCILPNILAA